MKRLLLGIATLIIASCNAPAQMYYVSDTTEINNSLDLEFRYELDTLVREIDVDFSYIEDVIWYPQDSAFCVEYFDPDAFDADNMEYFGYKFYNTSNPTIRCWVALEDIQPLLECYRAYVREEQGVKDAINNNWCILTDGLNFQFIRRFVI